MNENFMYPLLPTNNLPQVMLGNAVQPFPLSPAAQEELCIDWLRRKARSEAEIELEKVRTENKIHVLLERERIKREERERKAEMSKELRKLENGHIYLVANNCGAVVNPPEITNLENPFLIKYLNMEVPVETCFCLGGNADGRKVEIYLDAEKIARKDYAMKKLTEHGIFLQVPKSKLHSLFCLFIAKLSKDAPAFCVPMEAGWVYGADGKISFYEEWQMTWKQIKILSR